MKAQLNLPRNYVLLWAPSAVVPPQTWAVYSRSYFRYPSEVPGLCWWKIELLSSLN